MIIKIFVKFLLNKSSKKLGYSQNIQALMPNFALILLKRMHQDSNLNTKLNKAIKNKNNKNNKKQRKKKLILLNPY